MRMIRSFVSLLFCFITVCSCTGRQDNVSDGVDATAWDSAEETVIEYGIPVSSMDHEDGVVERNDYFARIMNRIGLDNNEAYLAARACDGVFDLRRLKVGNSYRTYYDKADSTGKPSYWRYDNDALSYLVISFGDSLSARLVDKEIEIETLYAEVTVDNSLWLDVQNAGVSPYVALEIADIYQWTIDFFGLQKGDWFKVMYDQATYRGEVLYIDKVHYCVFNHGGKDNYAYWYDQGDGSSNRYWNENGESLKKAFLKAPLKFTRISSGFTYARKHPITRVVRPHTGIDYAAPSGTPVMSIGDGVVTQRSYQGGGGNTVKIKHNSVYTSAYLHLSKYGPGIKVGSRVKQGQIIGYVGSTGMSTGPHLDFRIWKNGSPINPLKMESPSIEPVKKENMPAFKAYISRYENCQDSLKAVSLCNDYIELLF